MERVESLARERQRHRALQLPGASAVVGAIGPALRQNQAHRRPVAPDDGVAPVLDRDGDRQIGVPAALLNVHLAFRDLDGPVAAAFSGHVVLDREVLRNVSALRCLRGEARWQELLEELLRGDAVGNGRLLCHRCVSSSRLAGAGSVMGR